MRIRLTVLFVLISGIIAWAATESYDGNGGAADQVYADTPHVVQIERLDDQVIMQRSVFLSLWSDGAVTWSSWDLECDRDPQESPCVHHAPYVPSRLPGDPKVVQIEARAHGSTRYVYVNLIALFDDGSIGYRDSRFDGLLTGECDDDALDSDCGQWRLLEGSAMPDCTADLDRDRIVGFEDLLTLLSTWGLCDG